MVQHITVKFLLQNIFHSQNSLVMDGSALEHFKHPDYKKCIRGTFQVPYACIYIFNLKYSEKSENIIGLDSYILNSLNYLNLIWIYISHCMTSLLKLEITVYFFWLSLPVHSGSLKRIDYPKQICLAHTLSF